MVGPGFLIDNKYKIIRRIGSGTFGNVFLAINIRTGRKWAVKEIRKNVCRKLESREVFQNEIQALKNLEHKNIASISDFYEVGEDYYIFTDYIDGVTLDHIGSCRKKEGEQFISLNTLYTIGLELSEALCYLQEHSLIHGDIKPSNIMIDKEGHPVLIDFGGAVFLDPSDSQRLTVWTPGYSPPEAETGTADQTTDIFSFGAVLYRILTGNSPEKSSDLKTIHAAVTGYRRKTDQFAVSTAAERKLLRHLCSVIIRCTQEQQEKRYENAAKLYMDYRKIPETRFGSQLNVADHSPVILLFVLLIPVLCAASVYGGVMENKEKGRAYENCITEAKRCIREEAAQYYRLAIMLEPSRKEGYLGLIESLSSDNDLSGEDDAFLTEAMNSIEYDRTVTNEEYLRSNEEEYFDVAYKMGITYYYCSPDLNRSTAYKYLSDAAGYDNPFAEESEQKEEQKQKSDILVRMIRYENILGIPDARGENERSYRDYWQDMKELIHSDHGTDSRDLTFLWICEDMLNRIFTDASLFKKEGINTEEMQEEIRWIGNKIRTTEDPSEGIQAKDLRKRIRELLPLVREKLSAEDASDQNEKEGDSRS